MKEYPIEIDDYLSGTMSASEKIAFEERLLQDPELAEELKLQMDIQNIYEDKKWIKEDKKALDTVKGKQLKSFYKSDEAKDLKSVIKEVVEENRSKSTNRTFWFIGIAASIAVLITVSLFVFKKPSYDELYAAYIQVDEIPSVITRGEDTNKLLENAQLSFDDKNYQKAAELFTEYQNHEKSIEPLSYVYHGIAYIELNEFEEALAQFELLSNSNTLQSKTADWYKAMVFLKQHKTEKLINVLQNIRSDTHNYKFKEAKELLEKIDS